MEHEFTTEKTQCEESEYILVYCERCGIVSYDQRYESKSYKNTYIPSSCLGEVKTNNPN